MKNFEHLYGMEHYIPADNLSKGFHGVLFGYLQEYADPKDKMLLVGENENVIPVFRERITVGEIHTIGYDGERGERHPVDLNIRHEYVPEFDIIFCQALLEHLCRPSVAIENMADMTKHGGVIILHTHNTKMKYHGFPGDCCRFYKDYFIDLQEYINIKLREYDEWDEHIFACYQKKGN